MDYVNYYITVFIIIIGLGLNVAITNIGPNDGSSIPKDFKRHIGLAPDTNWEPGLREAAHQSLLKEHVTLNHLREKILQAPMSGQGAKVSPFGDVAIIARGQLFANSNGFRFVQDPHPNDCIDCHELRQCYGKECEIYLHNGLGERLIALWTVKRLRHRNPDVRYELEYSISPIRKHVWVTKNGGYDYSIPGHVFVVKTGQGQGQGYPNTGFNQNGYFSGSNQKGNHDKYGDLPHYPHPAVPPKIHSNKTPFVPSKPVLNSGGEWVQINQPPLNTSPTPDKLPNYYLPQRKPGDQTALTSQKDAQPTLDYAEIEAYKNLLQVLHQKTSTTEQKYKPTKVTLPTKGTTPINIPVSTMTFPTRPPLSHTTWMLPTTKRTKPTTKVTKPTFATISERPRTTKIVETTRTPGYTKPSIVPTKSYETTKQTTSQSRPGTTSSFRPTTIIDQSTSSAQQSSRPQTIYQQLGGFDSFNGHSQTNLTSTLAMSPVTTQTKPWSTQSITYPMKTTIPMTHLPTQPSFTSSSSFSQDTTRLRETTQPMTTFTTKKIPKPTKPMTTQGSTPTKPLTTSLAPQPTRPITTAEWTRPADGQTTSTFLFSTKVTAPFGIGVTRPIGITRPIGNPNGVHGVTQSQNTISTFYVKPGLGTSFQTDAGKTQYYDKTTLPMQYPTSSTFPGSTQTGSTFHGGDTTFPVGGSVGGVTIPVRGTDQSNTTPSRGTTVGTTYGNGFTGSSYPSTSGTISTRYPTTQYLPSTTSGFTRPTIYQEGTKGTTIEDHRTTYYPSSTTHGGSGTPTRPTGLLETTKVTFPTTNGYQRPRPIPTFFIDPTHPGYPKTTPTTPFTDGQNFKPSQPDPVYHPISETKPSTVFTTPTRPTITDFTNTAANGNTVSISHRPTSGKPDQTQETYGTTDEGHNGLTVAGTGTTILVPSSSDRYTPPSTAHSHTINLPTKLPKPSTPFKLPAIDDYDVDLFPRDPNVIRTTTTTTTPPTLPTGDFILPEENYKPHILVPELNQEEVNVFDNLSPVTSTTEGYTSTINTIEIKEVFDSATFKPKPPIDESVFDELFKQDIPTSTLTALVDDEPKVIYSDFFEASTVPPTRVLEAFTTPPSTSQSYSTSVSIEVNNKNNGNKGKIVKKLKFRKAKVKELPPVGEYKVFKAEHPEQHQNQDLIENIEITNNGNHPEINTNSNTNTNTVRYGPKGRKYKNKFKPTLTASTGVTFDDLALQLVNHARTIDYLEAKATEAVVTERTENPKSKVQRNGRPNIGSGSNTNLQNRNKYKRKSYGRVRKVKKRTENKATITRTNRGAIKAHNSTSTLTVPKATQMNVDIDHKVDEASKFIIPVENIDNIS